MKQLTLTITEDQKYEFFRAYDKLGDVQKRIWRATVWWCNRFPNAHPRQSKIAEHVGCSREHVNRTFQTFGKLGWLYLVSRGIKRAKILCVPDHLLQLDVVKREYFKRVEITTQITHSYNREENLTSRAGEIGTQPIIPSKRAAEIKCSPDSCLKLGLLPEYIIEETLYQAKKLGASGFIPKDPERYFVGMAFGMAKNKGLKVDWPKYYSQRATL